MTNEELVAQIQTGVDVQENMGLLYEQCKKEMFFIARPFNNKACMDDLMQEAYLGLDKAVKGYDVNSEFKFMTYAQWIIMGHLQRYCIAANHPIRLPYHLVEQISKYFRIIKEYDDEHSELPSDDYIANAMEISKNKLAALKKTIHESKTISLNEIHPETEQTIEETIADEGNFADDIIQQMAEEENSRKIWKCVDELPQKMKEYIYLRYREGLTQLEIANKCGVSISLVSAYIRKAHKLLKEMKEIKEAAEFYGLYSYDSALLYHDTFSFFKNHGMSAIEYYTIKKMENEERQKRIERKMKNMGCCNV